MASTKGSSGAVATVSYKVVDKDGNVKKVVENEVVKLKKG